MAELSHQEAVDLARAAADQLQRAADAAQAYADAAAIAAHNATAGAIDPFVFRFSIFALAVFVGYYVVWSVTPALHTPLLSVGVQLIGSESGPIIARVLGFVALVFASVNIFGGFLVTQRMLAMYQKKK